MSISSYQRSYFRLAKEIIQYLDDEYYLMDTVLLRYDGERRSIEAIAKIIEDHFEDSNKNKQIIKDLHQIMEKSNG